MQSVSLFQFGSGGGGVWGDGHRILIRGAKFAEHSFETKDRDTGVVTQVWEPGCMAQFDLQILDPADPSDEKAVYRTEFYSVGNLPARRVQEKGFTVDPKRMGGLGGYQPSLDNETPAESGPFVVAEGKRDVYAKAAYPVLMTAFLEKGLNEHVDRLSAQGLACLVGTIFVGEAITLPPPKNPKPDYKEKQILGPGSVEVWGWENPNGAGQQQAEAPTTQQPATAAAAAKGKPGPKPKAVAATAAAAPAAAPTATSAPSPTPTAAPAPSVPAGGIANFASASDEQKNRAVEVIQELVGKGPVDRKMLPGRAFGLLSKDGPGKVVTMQILNDPETIEFGASMGLWQFDPATNVVSAVQ